MALTIYLTKLASCLTLCFALVSCLGPYYSYERIELNLPGSVKGEVGLWSANGSPMFCDDGAVYFLGSPSPVLFNAPLGNCTTPQLNVLRSFSILAVVFSGIAFLFASTLDQIIAPKTNNLAALALSSAGLISTFIVVGTFSDYVDPTRADNNYGACELSPSFSGLMCDERLEWGFWFNVATALTQVSSICMFSCKLRSLKTDSLHEYAPDQTTALLFHMATVAKVLHFVKFCAILVATFGAYVKLNPRSNEYLTQTFPTTTFTTTSIYTSLWDGSLCWEGGFYDTFKIPNRSPTTYGNCSSSTLRLVQSFVCMALTLSVFNVIGSDEHARSSYVSAIILVVSLIFELFTLTFTIAAAAIYQAYIFPGRLDDNYCNLVGVVGSNGIRVGCKQTMSYGIFMLYVAVGVTFASFGLALIAPIKERADLLDAIATKPTMLTMCSTGDEEEGGGPATPAITPALVNAVTVDMAEEESEDSDNAPEEYRGLQTTKTEDLVDDDGGFGGGGFGDDTTTTPAPAPAPAPGAGGLGDAGGFGDVASTPAPDPAAEGFGDDGDNIEVDYENEI